MDLHLNGRRALVTGASRGIGLAIVRALLTEGAEVFAVARGHAPDVGDLGDGFRYSSADLTTEEGLDAVDAFLGDGGLDVLVNNVGAAPARPGGFASILDADWLRTLELDLLTGVRVTRRMLPRLGEGAAIVNVVSVNAQFPDPVVMDYSAAKAAQLSFTKALSKELAPRRIRVNAVSPGPVATDLWLGDQGFAQTMAAAGAGAAADVRAGAEAAMPLGRFARPDEVADVVAILASPRFGNVTGSEFTIDGGMRTTI